MTVEPASSPLTAAHFWRWLLVPILLLVGLVEPLQLLSPVAALFKAAAGDPVKLIVAGQVANLLSVAPFGVYAIAFLVNAFFVQRLVRITGGRRIALTWLLATLVVVAVVIAGCVLRFIFGGLASGLVATRMAGFGSPAIGMAVALVGLIPNAGIGAVFGLLLWSLQQHAWRLADRTPRLIHAHIWGGIIAGVVLVLRGVVLNAAVLLFGRLPEGVGPAVSLIGLAIAFVPHLIMTWRAVVPALAGDVTSTGGFVARFLVTAVLLAALFTPLYVGLAQW